MVDNVVIDDSTSLSSDKIIQEITEVAYEMQGGINQDFVFETHTAKLATLVRTNFEHFENQQACEEEWGNLLAQNQELSGIINSLKNCLEIYKLERGGKAGIDVGLSGLLGLNAMIEHSKNSSDEKKIKVKIISTEGIISAGIEYQRTTNSSSGIKEESIKVGVGVIVNNKEKMAGIRIELLPRKKLDIVKLAPEQVLNEGSEVELRELFQIYKIQEQQQTQIE
ncbi:1562_t:CDS:2 [Funneliformis geosporum]|uniref:1562_t:CDS:1 n=1 Tax=Funneliformis geosporum TaxID=1117311 RepID=A0A9W4SD35_9GLOM|nr:1562_t:CDS:2 [Funneliformis geosporum]